MLKRKIKESTTDPPRERLFCKGVNKNAHTAWFHTACDRNRFVLGTVIEPANDHEEAAKCSRPCFNSEERVALASYEFASLMPDTKHRLSQNFFMKKTFALLCIQHPQTKKGFMRKHEYVYGSFYDVYICP